MNTTNAEQEQQMRSQELPRRRQRRRFHAPRTVALLALAVPVGLLGMKQCGVDIPAVPKVHEKLTELPPEIDDQIVVTKLGAIGAYAKSVQTYKSKAHVRLVNEDNEERETLGYIGKHKVVRTQEGVPTVTHDDVGNKTVTLPSTLGIIAQGSFKVLEDDTTGRDFGQAVVGWGANSQTPRNHGEDMYTDAMEAVAAHDTISTRQTLCVGVAATSQFLSSLQVDGYFVPGWQAPGTPAVVQPEKTRTITVQAKLGDETLDVNSCAKDLADIGYDSAKAGNMQAGGPSSDAEVEAGMLLPERRIEDRVLHIGMDDYLKASKK